MPFVYVQFIFPATSLPFVYLQFIFRATPLPFVYLQLLVYFWLEVIQGIKAIRICMTNGILMDVNG
jgi:hypothetical protein